jgi:hypothetical protein
MANASVTYWLRPTAAIAIPSTVAAVVPCDDDEVWIAHSIRGRKVYSVIAPMTVGLCDLPCVPSERVVDLDEIKLFVSRVECRHHPS